MFRPNDKNDAVNTSYVRPYLFLKESLLNVSASVGSWTFSPPTRVSRETHVRVVYRCPFCACPVQGFQLLESRQVYEHILALEDEAAGLRAQLKRFSSRVSCASVFSYLWRPL